MGCNSSKPKWPPIKYIRNDGICYLTDPPQYSPNVVIFEKVNNSFVNYFKNGSEKILIDHEILAELKRQNKSHLWNNRYMSEADIELRSFLKELIRLKKIDKGNTFPNS
jgi:hypothetical protein